MRNVKRISALLLACLLAVTPMVACNSETPDPADTTVADTTAAPVTTEAPAVLFDLVKEGKSDFTIVRSDLSSDAITKATTNLRNAIEAKTGCSMAISTDWIKRDEPVPTDTPEILVGTTNRAESIAAAEKLADGEFVIELVSPKRVVILGYSDDATIAAINAFVAQYVDTAENNTLALEEETRYAGAVYDKYATLRNVSSNLVTTPSIVTRANTADDLAALSTATPATVILDFADGKAAGVSIGDAMKQVSPNSMPAFRVESQAALDNLLVQLDILSIKDYFVMSSDINLLKQAVDADTNARGIYDCTGMTAFSDADLFKIRQTANANFLRVVLLPESAATRENVYYLQRLLITVWVDGGADDSTTDLVRMITSGANGIVTQKRAELEEAFTKYFGAQTFSRPFLVIGHRGMPSKAPENTVEGSLLAYDYGADIVENDVYLSKDGHVVVMHDSTIDRTTNGQGKIESMTLAQIKKYYVNKQFGDKYPNCEIPTLAEYFEAFKDNDCHIFIEIKTKNTAIVQKMAEVIKQYNFEDRVSIIAFGTDMMRACKKFIPEISLGYLVSNYADTTKVEESVKKVTELVGDYHTTFNPNYASINEGIIDGLQARGITLWPWTLNDATAFYQYIFWGANGVTTNYANYSAEMFRGIKVAEHTYTAKVGETVAPALTLDRYDRKEEAINPANLTLTILEGADIAKVDGATVTATGAGKISFIYSYTDKTLLRQAYSVVSEPITITVG